MFPSWFLGFHSLKDWAQLHDEPSWAANDGFDDTSTKQLHSTALVSFSSCSLFHEQRGVPGPQWAYVTVRSVDLAIDLKLSGAWCGQWLLHRWALHPLQVFRLSLRGRLLWSGRPNKHGNGTSRSRVVDRGPGALRGSEDFRSVHPMNLWVLVLVSTNGRSLFRPVLIML